RGQRVSRPAGHPRRSLAPASRDSAEVVGGPRGGPDGELKNASRELGMQYYPDRNPGDKDGEERFKEVNEAYTVLSDPEKRAHFDRFGTVGPAAGGGGPDTGFGTLFEDIFENFFSGGARSSRRSRATRGEDLQYALKIALEEARAGVERKLQPPRR